MAHYSPDFLTSLRHRYEKTDQPMIELAREFGIGITTLQMLVDKQGWEKRSQRLRGVPHGRGRTRGGRAGQGARRNRRDVPLPDPLPCRGRE